MEQYISKNALVAEIKRLIKHSEMVADHNTQITELVSRELDALYHLISFLDTLEVKDAIDALRTEYEKGRADVIAKTLEWINVFNDNNYIMQYSDSYEHPINEIIEWYKNYINRE